MNSIVHMAGPVIHLNGRAIQRCPICGYKLVDTKGMMTVLDGEGNAEVKMWIPGQAIEVTEGFPTEFRILPEITVWPENNCFVLCED